MWKGWLTHLLPLQCLLCGGDSGRGISLCRPCEALLPWHGPACPRCAHHLSAAADPDLPCGACLRTPPPLARSLAAFDYAGPIPRLVAGLKFGHELAHAAVLGELLATRILAQESDWPEAILPVPLHASRLAERGFNQALELARPVARRLGLPLLSRACTRVLATPEQSTLTEAERKRNLRRAFAVTGPLPASLALIDDVITTGSTAAALARTLARAGVAEIRIWAVAKTRQGRPG